jgi:hypothetical protein
LGACRHFVTCFHFGGEAATTRNRALTIESLLRLTNEADQLA